MQEFVFLASGMTVALATAEKLMLSAARSSRLAASHPFSILLHIRSCIWQHVGA